MTQYAFVLGRVFTLSLAELLVLVSKRYPEAKLIDASFEVAIFESPTQMDVQLLQKELGGVIKIIKVVDVIKKREQDSLNFALQNYFKPGKLKKDFLKNTKGKIQFGVSIYLLGNDVKAFGESKKLGMFIKRAMQDSGSSIRLVLPEFNSLALASVVVTGNLLIEKGAEICILAGHETIYICKTLSVQDFEDYGRRDYQRPARDDKHGMVPPKVAQSMLNLAKVNTNEVILDPFCGVGTLLQEGMLLNYRMFGTDISKLAIANSEKNLEWFRNRYKIAKGKYHLELSDAQEVSKVVSLIAQTGVYKTISGIVSEGYLGPMYTSFPKAQEIEKNFKEISSLWSATLKDAATFLPKGARVVFSFPAYKKDQQSYILLPNLDSFTKNGYSVLDLIPKEISKKYNFLRLTERGSVIYDRKDQIVAREIILLEKN